MFFRFFFIIATILPFLGCASSNTRFCTLLKSQPQKICVLKPIQKYKAAKAGELFHDTLLELQAESIFDSLVCMSVINRKTMFVFDSTILLSERTKGQLNNIFFKMRNKSALFGIELSQEVCSSFDSLPYDYFLIIEHGGIYEHPSQTPEERIRTIVDGIIVATLFYSYKIPFQSVQAAVFCKRDGKFYYDIYGGRVFSPILIESQKYAINYLFKEFDEYFFPKKEN